MTGAGYLDRTPGDSDQLRLFCFHHAGAGASAFTGWRAALAPAIDVYPVQLPGRENRVREPRRTDFAELIEELDAQLGPWLTGDYACYGHSMGALIGYALVRHRIHNGHPAPRSLLVGAYPGPHLRPPLSATGMTDDQLADLLVRVGGMSETVRRYPTWATAATDLLRDDLALLHSYRREAAPRPLPVRLDVFAGADDPLLRADETAEWARHAGGPFHVHTVPGGHFFLRDSTDTLLSLITEALAPGGRRSAAS
ncbi:MAG TPA: thioesterase domain-containing protein [Pseudonocardiaceae bacterium]|jgi:surfactin synthase thioesterase subunit|nr:thioesterase domain-containing protein [Pseudonocardiaceae bacterium]